MTTEPNLLKPHGVFPVGKRTMALYDDSFNGKSYLALGEVQAVVDPKDPTKVIGWRSAFKGARIQLEPEAMKKLLEDAYGAVRGMRKGQVPS